MNYDLSKDGHVRRMVGDYKKLEDNLFWQYFMDCLENQQNLVAKDLAAMESATAEKMRIYQGMWQGFNKAKALPELLNEELKNTLKEKDFG